MSDQLVDRSLSQVFGVDAINAPVPAVLSEAEERVDADSDDYDLVRRKLHALLIEGASAFEHLSAIAKSEEKISAFTALNEMLGGLSDISMKILDVKEKKIKVEQMKQKLLPKEGADPGQVINNNTIFIGSTTQFLDMINQEDVIDVECKENE